MSEQKDPRASNLVALPKEFDPMAYALETSWRFLFNQREYTDYRDERTEAEFTKVMPYLLRYQDESPTCKSAIEYIAACRESWRIFEQKAIEKAAAKAVAKRETQKLRSGVASSYNKLFVQIGRRDGFTCAICKYTGSDLRIDHIHPVSKGGGNELTNLQLLCHPCNSRKGNRIAE